MLDPGRPNRVAVLSSHHEGAQFHDARRFQSMRLQQRDDVREYLIRLLRDVVGRGAIGSHTELSGKVDELRPCGYRHGVTVESER